MKRVLDASAVMVFFEDSSGSEKVEEVLNQSLQGKGELLMSVINWGEVYYSLWRKRGQAAAEEKLHFLSGFPIDIISADAAMTKFAASLKAQRKLPYADCFAAAVAATHGGEIITADADFKLIRDIVPVSFL